MAVELTAEDKDLADKMANLTLKRAVDIASYLDETYGIKPAAGGVVMTTGPAAAVEAPAVKTEFTPVLESYDAAKKINVIKVVREITGLGLKEAKDLVDGAPKPVKDGVSKEDAAKMKASLEEQGATTRLISRNRFRLPTLMSKIGMLPMEPGSLVMERKMLLGIKERAERLAREESEQLVFAAR